MAWAPTIAVATAAGFVGGIVGMLLGGHLTKDAALYQLVPAVALIVGILTAWVSDRNTSRQLQHDANEREKARKAQIRERAFMDAATAAAAYARFLGEMANPDLPLAQQQERILPHLGALERLALVASSQTVREVGAAVVQFARLSMPLGFMKGELTGLAPYVLARVAALDGMGTPEATKESLGLQQELRNRQVALGGRGLQALAEWLPSEVAALLALRRELGVTPADEQAAQAIQLQLVESANIARELFEQWTRGNAQ